MLYLTVCCCCSIGGQTYIYCSKCIIVFTCLAVYLYHVKGLKYLFKSLTLISEHSSPLSSYGQHCTEETFVSLSVTCFFNIKHSKFSRSHRYIFLLKPLIVSIISLVVKNFIYVFSSAAFSFHWRWHLDADFAGLASSYFIVNICVSV